MDPNAPVNQPPVLPTTQQPLQSQPAMPVQVVAPPPGSPPPPPSQPHSAPAMPPTPQEPPKKERNVKMWIAIYVVLGIIAYALLYVFVLSKKSDVYTPPSYRSTAPRVINKPKPLPTPAAASTSATIAPTGKQIIGTPSAPLTSVTPTAPSTTPITPPGKG